MALGYTVKVRSVLFQNNDDQIFQGVSGISLGADGVTLTLTGSSGVTNWGATATQISLVSAGRVEITHEVLDFPGNTLATPSG